MPVGRGTLSALRHVVYGDPKRLFSFALAPEELAQFGRVCERFLTTQLDRGFRTLEFYKDLAVERPLRGAVVDGTTPAVTAFGGDCAICD